MLKCIMMMKIHKFCNHLAQGTQCIYIIFEYNIEKLSSHLDDFIMI